MTELRRLDPVNDHELIAEALSWVDEFPLWMRESDAAWGQTTVNEYCNEMATTAQADFGVFDNGEFVGEICLASCGNGRYNSHLMFKRKSNVNCIIVAAMSIAKQLKEHGAVAIWSWPLKQNRGLHKVLEAIGMRRDGLEMFKGQSHGKPLCWVRYAI